MLRKVIWGALPGLTALVTCLALPGQGGATDDAAVPKHIDRPKLSESFRNTGTQGALFPDYAPYVGQNSQSMNYPLIFSGSWRGSFAQENDNDNSKGEGVWILAKDAAGKVYITSSGPAYVTDDVAEKPADLTPGGGNLRLRSGEDHPFVKARLGYDTKDANVWFNSDRGGAGGQTRPPDPVEIDNYRENGKYTLPKLDHFPEETVITRWSSNGSGTGTGLTMTRYAYGWSHPDFDDFFIVELVVENTSSRDYDEVYMAYMNFFSVSAPGHSYRKWNGWWFTEAGRRQEDDRYQYTEASNYTGKYKGTKVSYQYDGDSPFSSENDQGEPRYGALAANIVGYRAEAEVLSPAYIGWGPVDVVPPFINDPETYVPPTGAAVGGPDIPADQPRYSHWWKRTASTPVFEPNQEIDTVVGMWNKIITPGLPIDPNSVQGGPRVEEWELQEQQHCQVYGPYKLRQGEKAKIVLVFAAGMASEVAGPGGEPMDERLWAISPGAQAALPNGEAVLFNHVERGRQLYRMGYDLPNQPPDVPSLGRAQTDRPLLLQSNSSGHTEMTWTDGADTATHPDYTGAEANDVAGYVIYRSSGLVQTDPVKHSGTAAGPWRVLAKINAKDPKYYSNGVYKFTDENSVTGFPYWYNIVTYANGHATWENVNAQKNAIPGAQAPTPTKLSDLPAIVQKHAKAGYESSHLVEAARHTTVGASFVPVTAASDDFDALAQKVLVVPNPWKDDGVHSFGAKGDNNKRMRFVNLPRLARISIYTTAGDMVVQIVFDGTRTSQHTAEVDWQQQAWSGTSRAAPGIYFFAVESLVPGHIGKTQIGKFMIIQ